jgi:hypothetical protein
MSLFLIRSTLRCGWAVGLAIGAGIALVDALSCWAWGSGSLAWVTALASVVAVARRAAGERALRTADAIAGAGRLGFGGVLAYGAVRADG